MNTILVLALTLNAGVFADVPDVLQAIERQEVRAAALAKTAEALEEQRAQFDLLRGLIQACERVMQAGRPPFICFRAQGIAKKSGFAYFRAVSCASHADELKSLAEFPSREDEHFLPEDCLDRLMQRRRVLEYKNTGSVGELPFR